MAVLFVRTSRREKGGGDSFIGCWKKAFLYMNLLSCQDRNLKLFWTWTLIWRNEQLKSLLPGETRAKALELTPWNWITNFSHKTAFACFWSIYQSFFSFGVLEFVNTINSNHLGVNQYRRAQLRLYIIGKRNLFMVFASYKYSQGDRRDANLSRRINHENWTTPELSQS